MMKRSHFRPSGWSIKAQLTLPAACVTGCRGPSPPPWVHAWCMSRSCCASWACRAVQRLLGYGDAALRLCGSWRSRNSGCAQQRLCWLADGLSLACSYRKCGIYLSSFEQRGDVLTYILRRWFRKGAPHRRLAHLLR